MSEVGKARTVCVSYRCGLDGETEMKFAADLHRRLNRDGARLTVFMGEVSANNALAVRLYGEGVAEAQAHRVAEAVSRMTGVPAAETQVLSDDLRRVCLPPEAIAVSRQLAHERKPFSVLVPFSETGLDCRVPGPVLVPFGAYDSGRVTAAAGLALAKELGRDVVLWHTTLPRKGVADSAPSEKHMCDGALSVRQDIEALAVHLGVKLTTVVERADTIPGGIVDAAHRAQAGLIVMSRDPKTKYGDYVEKVLKLSAVPVLIAPSGEVC